MILCAHSYFTEYNITGSIFSFELGAKISTEDVAMNNLEFLFSKLILYGKINIKCVISIAKENYNKTAPYSSLFPYCLLHFES